MIKKIKGLTCKALVLSMLASTVLPGFSGSAYGAYGEKAAADSEKTEYVLSEIESLLKGSAPYDILIKCTWYGAFQKGKGKQSTEGATGTTGTENKGSVCDGVSILLYCKCGSCGHHIEGIDKAARRTSECGKDYTEQ